ncbi:hypothetical protein EHV15_10445 [Paenibacillus oralis]|uniref:5-bromo-4-chloroindolyl phosphate hydrolysis protein n=1 Tax=Paenibacillus oralis TaxID=2490856 RepID=A0A3P3TYX4_9BACL|nr:hypothetical protein [Paenibacillus oralis]RRJ63295.1 hypothetical protein EHV15_10445 [Paenibacillus oralis]
MTRYKLAGGISLLGFIASLFTAPFLPEIVNLLIPTLFSLAAIALLSRLSGAKPQGPEAQINERVNHAGTSGAPTQAQNLNQNHDQDQAQDQARPAAENAPEIEKDPFWGPVMEYIQVTEEMVISEGQKNNLDDEIVEKTLSLLARVNRLIPQLKTLHDGNINHNIQRLIFKDLNGAINPFLNLSGEAKRQNRRLLLTGIKDINTKLSSYVETIEHRDLIELQTRVDLIQQRYRSN